MHAISLPELLGRGDSFVPIAQRTPPRKEAILAGIYTPPVLAEVSGRSAILWGVETVRRGREAGAEALYCEDLGPMSPIEAVETVLTVENRPGTYGVAELVELVDLLHRFDLLPTDRIRELVDGKKRGLLSQAERAYALPPEVRHRVTAEEVSLRHGEQLAELPEGVRVAVEARLGEGSFSSRRELLAMTWESWKRRREEDPAVEKRLIEALSAPEPREPLRRLRYPSYAEARQRLDRFRSTHIAGSGLKLEEPPNFEGDHYTLTIPFRSVDDLRRKVEYLTVRVVPVIGEITELLG